MSDDARERARVRNPMLLISAIAWGLMLIDPGGMLLGSTHGGASHAAHVWHVGHVGDVTYASNAAPVAPVAQVPNLAQMAAGWIVMLIAMMTPALIPPVRHIRLRSFAHRRVRAISLFVIAYAAIWIAAGAVLIALARGLNLFAPAAASGSASAPYSYLPVAVMLLAAFVWQCSPVKQRCLNRSHRHTELPAFGAAADIGVLRFGAVHGVWCAGACWLLMLVPLLLPRGHTLAMAAATVVIISERFDQPRRPRWEVRGPGKLLRAAIAQTRIRLNSPRYGLV